MHMLMPSPPARDRRRAARSRRARFRSRRVPRATLSLSTTGSVAVPAAALNLPTSPSARPSVRGIGRIEHGARLEVERMRLQGGRAAHHGVAAVDRGADGDLETFARGIRGRAGDRLHVAHLHAFAQAGEVGELETVGSELATQRTQHAPAGTRLARQLAAGDRRLLAAVEVGQRRVDFRQQADRQDHVGDGLGRAAGEMAERHDLRRAQRLQRASRCRRNPGPARCRR